MKLKSYKTIFLQNDSPEGFPRGFVLFDFVLSLFALLSCIDQDKIYRDGIDDLAGWVYDLNIQSEA